MTRYTRDTRPAIAALLAAIIAAPWTGRPAHAAPAPTLWGYGVKSCGDFVAAAPGADTPAAVGSEDYLRYREWLAGLVTGINLATASDVLRGAELEAALGRIRTHCKAHPSDDFFNASMTLIRTLGRDKSPAGKGSKSAAD
ncbi:MAG: hypothetical protein JZU52_14190 [Lamprocystis purpurea]|jgi:hypothetical protein|uniref:hypothetical protein n=1 Tax=Lamprocystis purpurea TaxID=61598 RepID=UPI00035FE10B|nr:hypothetical protein [Lamprocystis purpurea]MBV5274733.1 hypothetical protein [Lamprocystis purpurea]